MVKPANVPRSCHCARTRPRNSSISVAVTNVTIVCSSSAITLPSSNRISTRPRVVRMRSPASSGTFSMSRELCPARSNSAYPSTTDTNAGSSYPSHTSAPATYVRSSWRPGSYLVCADTDTAPMRTTTAAEKSVRVMAHHKTANLGPLTNSAILGRILAVRASLSSPESEGCPVGYRCSGALVLTCSREH